ncbi:MAG: hypothetical protein WBN04_19630 [Paracoccaceae bacterium]
MAKKKSPAELKEEGVALGEQIAQARKKPYKFALSIGKDGLVLETDLKKSPDILWRNAKKNGGGPKGAMGMISVKGKTVELTCEDDSAPRNLPKMAKKFFSERGQPYKFVIITPSGELSDEDDDDDEEELQLVAAEEEDTTAEEETADTSAAEEEAVDEETLEAVEEATGEAVAPDPAPEAKEPPVGNGAGGEDAADALRDVLRKEFEDLAGDIETARQNPNPGMAKKTDALVDMFSKQIDGDLKKSASVLSLLKATLKDAGGYAKAAPAPAGGGADPALAANRKAQMEDLEKGVDALLAEFA